MSANKKKSRTSHRELFVVSKDAPFQFVEAYKSLRTNLEFLSATSNCKTILITSSVPEEGKSNVAINLAITLAASNKRVVLVDCDMRKSAISRYLRIPRSHSGLTNVITTKDVGKLPDALLRRGSSRRCGRLHRCRHGSDGCRCGKCGRPQLRRLPTDRNRLRRIPPPVRGKRASGRSRTVRFADRRRL